MFANKIKAKSDEELRGIANNPKNYQPAFLTATLHEIKKRGIQVETSELEIYVTKEDQTKKLSEQSWRIPENLHPNIKLASNLVFASIGLGILNLFLIGTSLTIGGSTADQLPGIIGILVVSILGYAIRLGMPWVRIIFLIFFIIGIIPGIAVLSFLFQYTPIAGTLNLLQTLIQLYVLILLFKKSTSEWYKANKRESYQEL